MKNKKLRVLLISFLSVFQALLFVLPVYATEMTKEKAKVLLGEQNWTQAQAAYMELLRAFPEDPEVLLALALTAKENHDYTRAMIFFEQLTARFPAEPRLWADLASVYTALGNTSAAGQAQERVATLGGIALPQPAGAGKDLDLLTVRGWVGMGVLYDDNVFLEPTKKEFRMGGRRFILDSEYRAKESWGGYVRAGLDLNRRLQAKGPWSLVADVNGQRKHYFDESQATTYGRAAVGMRYASPNHSTTVRFKVEQDIEEYNNQVNQFGTEGLYTYRLFPRVFLITRGELVRRDYQDSSGHSGTAGWVGEYLRFFISDKTDLMLGGRWINTDANTAKYSSQGWEASGVFRYSLPFDAEIRLDASFEQKNYDEPAWKWLSSKREDEKIRLGATLNYSFTENLSAELRYQYLKNDSNTDIFDYDQNVVSTGINWNF